MPCSLPCMQLAAEWRLCSTLLLLTVQCHIVALVKAVRQSKATERCPLQATRLACYSDTTAGLLTAADGVCADPQSGAAKQHAYVAPKLEYGGSSTHRCCQRVSRLPP